ncbi:hypothetical protein X766_33510 [Mesorhizobium sp. LSJC255A00]|nr:hypothetical protein X766_33510 [Mesorhizobium sp. LSJC255A00]
MRKDRARKKSLANVAERPLDLSFWRGKADTPWDGTIVAGKIDEGTVVDDAAGIAFADHSRLHTVVKHFARSAAQRLESPSMAAQDSRQILVDDEACPDKATEAKHHGE